jgi:hypothetical protein
MGKRTAIFFLAAIAAGICLALSDRVYRGSHAELMSSAEAIVGRPLTPVSVAGVANRSATPCPCLASGAISDYDGLEEMFERTIG